MAVKWVIIREIWYNSQSELDVAQLTLTAEADAPVRPGALQRLGQGGDLGHLLAVDRHDDVARLESQTMRHAAAHHLDDDDALPGARQVQLLGQGRRQVVDHEDTRARRIF